MTTMVGRRYLDPGDRWAGSYDPPRLCIALVAGRASTRRDPAGPRTVWVRYLDDGSEAVIPFPRRLRLAPTEGDPIDMNQANARHGRWRKGQPR